MAYTVPDIKAALVTILQAVTGIGKVHSRDMWTNEPKQFREWFWNPSTGVINATVVTRGGYLPALEVSRLKFKRHKMRIYTVYSFMAETDTEAPFNALIDAQCDAINNNTAYTNAWHCFFPGDVGAQADTIDVRSWAGVFVHYAEIFVTVEVRST